MTMRKVLAVAGVLLILLVAVVILFRTGLRQSKPAAALAETRATLTLKWLYDPGFAGELVAKRGGLFANEGLDVAIQPGGFEIDPIRLVASGASQFGVAGADSFLIARSRGIPVVAIAAGYIQTPVAYYYKAGSGIHSVSDLPGKTVGLQAGQDTETLLYAMMGVANVARTSIRFYPAKYNLSPFLNGQVDVWPGYVATQSYVLRKQGVAFGVLRPKDVGLNVPGTVYFTSESFFAEHPDTVARFVRAVRKGWNWTYQHPDAAAKIISSYDSKAMPTELVLSNLRDQRDQVLPEGYTYLELKVSDWTKLNDVLLTQNLITAKVDLTTALRPQTN
jgi:NitT/TauT family transport system substrate-binding protein